MDYDLDRAGDLTLALMWISLHDGARVWKGYDWDVMNRLHEQGFITDPRGKAKSVVLTEAGRARSRALFEAYLTVRDSRTGPT
jgi:hypothetical protein